MLLHPVFYYLFGVIFFFSFIEVNFSKGRLNKYIFIFLASALAIVAGTRFKSGPDDWGYYNMFITSKTLSFFDILSGKSLDGVEAGYMLLNKFVSIVGLDYQDFLLVIAGLSLFLKASTLYKFSNFPLLALLMYFVPLYFFDENIQIRQGFANAVVVYSLRYILDRDLRKFLITMFIAFLIHRSSVVFLPAFWIVNFKFKNYQIVFLIIISLSLNVLGIMKVVEGFFDLTGIAGSRFSQYEITSKDISFKIGDLVKLFILVAIILFSKRAEAINPHFVKYKSIYVVGLFIFFLFHGTIYGIRLPGYYLFYLIFLLPEIIYSLRGKAISRLVISIILYLYIFLLLKRYEAVNSIDFREIDYENILINTDEKYPN